MNTHTTLTPSIETQYHAPLEQGKSGRLFVLAASSGVGKTTLVHVLCDMFKDTKHPVIRVITYTTRKPRTGEVDGVDYHFVDEADFVEKIHKGFFLEWSNAYGAYYGSPRSIENELKAGTYCITVLDRDGIRQAVAELGALIVPLWIYTDRATQQELLSARGTEGDEQKRLRAQLAFLEEEAERIQPLCAFHIKNNDLQEAVATIAAIITREMGVLSGVESSAVAGIYL
jgi:guanylate kinase